MYSIKPVLWDAHDNRVFDMKHLHWYSDCDVNDFLSYLNLQDMDFLLDVWCWDGRIWYSALYKNSNINLISMDLSQFQMKKAKSVFKKEMWLCENKPKFKLWSILETWLKDESVDKIIAKMVFHEIPLQKQKLAIKEMYRILKTSWRIVIWDIMLNEGNQKQFQNIFREKDRQAWFKTLLNNRYFFTESEFKKYSLLAWFIKIDFKKDVKFIFDPNKYLNTEFWWDASKLRTLKEKIFRVTAIDEWFKNEARCDGDWSLNVPVKIYVLTK